MTMDAFSLIMQFEESQGSGGLYALTYGQFTINGIYVGTLNTIGNTIKVNSAGANDIFELSSVATEAAGVVTAANFTGDEVWHKDGGNQSSSNTGAAGPNDRYFSLIFKDSTGSVLSGSNAIPTNLDQLAWTDLDIRIQWRKSSKISVKGFVTSITQVPEPSMMTGGFLALMSVGFATRRKRPALLN